MRSAGVDFGVEVEFSKYHIGDRAGHRAVADFIFRHLKVVLEFFDDPIEHFGAGELLHASVFIHVLAVVDMDIAIDVHSKQVIESAEDLGLSETGLLDRSVGAFVLTGNHLDVVDDGVALGHAAIGEAPTVVDVAGVAAPCVHMHSLRNSGVEPVGSAGGDNHFVGSVFLEAPVALTIDIAILACELGICVGDEGSKLGCGLEIVLLPDVGVNFRRKVCASNCSETKDCKNNGIYLFHILSIFRS